jgi:hypothetical protein
MQCPPCQHENPADQKFCGECGSRLASVCPSCGASNPPPQKFCGECGARLGLTDRAVKYGTPQSYTPRHLAEKILTSKAALEGERKQVTGPLRRPQGLDGAARRPRPGGGAQTARPRRVPSQMPGMTEHTAVA